MLCAALVGGVLAGPAVARALPPAGAAIIVNDPGDAGGGCDVFGNCRPCDGSGTCTLRQAIDVANAGGGSGWVGAPRTDIRFDFGSALGVIALTSALPDITRAGVTIRGTTAAGAAQDVLVDGTLTNSHLFTIRAGNVSITKLTILRPPPTNGGSDQYAAIRMASGYAAVIGENAIGVEADAGEGICNINSLKQTRNIGVLIENETSGSAAAYTAYVHDNAFGCLEIGVRVNGADWVDIGGKPDGFPGGNRFGLTGSGVATPLRFGVMIAAQNPYSSGPLYGNSSDNRVRHNVFAYVNQAIYLGGHYTFDGFGGFGANDVQRTYVMQNTIRNGLSYLGDSATQGIVVVGSVTQTYLGVPSNAGISPIGGNHIYQMGGAPTASGSCMIRITGDRTRDLVLARNFIGTNAEGTSARTNYGYGVCLYSAASTTIGLPNEGNVISGNSLAGIVVSKVLVSSPDSRGITIQANKIGVNINGDAPIPNGDAGVSLTSGREITVGGPQSAQGNVIAGNATFGVYLSAVSTTTLQSNVIGGSGAPLANGLDGVAIEGGSNTITLGGAGALNYIQRNGRTGVFIGGGAQNVRVQQNYIADNAGNGVWLRGANTAYNVINAATILSNGGDGIAEDTGAGINRWLPQVVTNNGGFGIDKGADNVNNVPYATVTGIATVGGTPRVSGSASFNASPARSVQVYRAQADPSGYGEGYQWIGTADVTPSGTWSIDDLALGDINGCYTAVLEEELVVLGLSTGYRTSYEFGPVFCVPVGGLALVVDRTGDRSPVIGPCTAVPNDCTLREAIAIANADGQNSTIAFDTGVFAANAPTDLVLDFGFGPLTLTEPGTTIAPNSDQVIFLYGTAISPEQLQPVLTIQASRSTIAGFAGIHGGAPYQIKVTGALTGTVIANNDGIGGPRGLSNPNEIRCDFLGTSSPFSQAGIYFEVTGGSLTSPVGWVYGNHIGCNTLGSGIVLSRTNAVRIGVDASGNYGPDQANRIGKNGTHGVYLYGQADQSTIRNNLIYSNTLDGIQLFSSNSFGPSSNVLGCAADGSTAANGANTVVRNGSSGIELSGPGTSLINYVACNYIGLVNHDWGVPGIAPTSEATLAANGNGAEGIALRNKAAFNVIGGVGDGVGNMLFGNANGIYAEDAPDNVFNRNAVVGSPNYAMLLVNGSNNAVLSNNTLLQNGGGVYVSASTGVQLLRGVIGDSTLRGIQLSSASGNTISETVVFGSGYSGITFDNAGGNTLTGGAVVSSTRHGIEFNGAPSTGNLIDGVTIAQNGLDGIADVPGVSGNRWFPTAVNGNGGLGIDRAVTSDGGNLVDAPPLTITQVNTRSLVIGGSLTVSYATPRVDVYVNRAGADPSGYGEGGQRIGTATFSSAQGWSIVFADMRAGDCYTALVSDGAQSSEFSQNVCLPGNAAVARRKVMLPLVRR